MDRKKQKETANANEVAANSPPTEEKKEVKAEEGWGGAHVVPTLHIGKWNFTGVSKL